MSLAANKYDTDPNVETLTGQITKLVYDNGNGWGVARLKPRGRKDVVKIAGVLNSPIKGENVELTGYWETHSKFGCQFSVLCCTRMVPRNSEGIQLFLASSCIKGVGPEMARRLVDKFGDRTLEIIDTEPERLAEVEGVGPKRIGMVVKSWEESKGVREVMIFLQGHGITPGLAGRIYRHYGVASVDVVKSNPYQLADDVNGIGFISADSIARKLGFPPDCIPRIEAGISHTLKKLAEDGHVFYPYEKLVARCLEILNSAKVKDDEKSEKDGYESFVVTGDAVRSSIDAMTMDGALVVEELPGNPVYLSKYFAWESGLAESVKNILAEPARMPYVEFDQALSSAQSGMSIQVNNSQEEALRSIFMNKVSVVTGGPGTGKTTIMNILLRMLPHNMKTVLCAPTGKAAKRLSEVTGFPAQTIHRLLEFNPGRGGFCRHEKEPLECQMIIIDEASMLDTQLAAALFRAIPAYARVVLVGDVDQIPPVGAGLTLGDIIPSAARSSGVHVSRLNVVWRQSGRSAIIVNCHRIKDGIAPKFEECNDSSDFRFIRRDEPIDVQQTLIDLAAREIPARYGFNPFTEIQVLSPMRKGIVGVEEINKDLQNALNPYGTKINDYLRVSDKIMQTVNNYDKLVWNGDTGIIKSYDMMSDEVIVDFGDREVVYDKREMDELTLAYAISVHKSQGSEFPVVIMPVTTQHYLMLRNNIIYTGASRGKKLVIIIGSKMAVNMAVRNKEASSRFTGLARRLVK